MKLKAFGLKQEEIAEQAGYKTHGAVSKRIRHISEKYAEYRNQ